MSYDEEKQEKVDVVVLREPVTQKELTFDREVTAKLQRRYDAAVENDEETFNFEGFEFVRDYAKYMLEFLDVRLV
jgi:hypothetical protein